MLNNQSCVLLQKEAIYWAWGLLVDVLKLPKERLYVTYFGGCAEFNLPPDEETKQIWLNLGWVEKEGGRERVKEREKERERVGSEKEGGR